MLLRCTAAVLSSELWSEMKKWLSPVGVGTAA